MSDREALEAAVKSEQRAMALVALVPALTTPEAMRRLVILAAARERLAQLPPYPAETVERLTEVWRTLWDRPPYVPWKDLPENQRAHLLKEAREAAVAVLDALGETL